MAITIELPQIFSINVSEYKQLPRTMGIYMIYGADNILIYAGKTQNIKTRMTTHMQIYRGLVSHISYFFVDNRVDLDIYETYVINTLKPLYNSAKLWYQLDEKFDKEQKEKLERRIKLISDKKQKIEDEKTRKEQEGLLLNTIHEQRLKDNKEKLKTEKRKRENEEKRDKYGIEKALLGMLLDEGLISQNEYNRAIHVLPKVVERNSLKNTAK